ncbi:hypothetical protein EVG20_g1145 [Dentipellis fragilis]|uniref:Inositol-pentakisphosphate 2-kinase n=1 Tax=Dentipellis fragilis TaxID=205917 RepID=A0A4Y9ZDF5_9AGAM|nr:hypothetical protein EVG20_g1145 [Dentipellis fragilis]
MPREHHASRAAKVSTTTPSDWKYVSEGGATAVFSYQGPPNPAFDGTALRLRKTSNHETKNDIHPDDPEENEPDDPMIQFQRDVIARLMPPQFLIELRVADLERPWMEAFAAYHEPSRPPARREADSIDVTRKKGIQVEDLVGNEGWSVEIKPKWGFLPSPAYLSPETLPIKTRTCRTCMHSHLRQSKGEVAAANYCPLDLFSGTEERVKRAIHGLWDSWNESGGTINNLRIFSGGRMLKPMDIEQLETWSQKTFGTGHHAQAELRDKFTAALLPITLGTSLLQRVGALQRTLDSFDREGFSELRERAWSMRPPVVSDREQSGSSSISDVNEPEPTFPEWFSFINTFTSPDTSDTAFPDPADFPYYLQAYLLSATFKDCSVMIKMPSNPEQQVVVKVIDLDVKSVKKLRQWEKLDQQIVEVYSQVGLDARKTCIDAWAIT